MSKVSLKGHGTIAAGAKAARPIVSADGEEWARLSELSPGDECRAVGFTCVADEVVVEIKKSERTGMLFFDCADGTHTLDGQLHDDMDHLVGLIPVESEPV